MRAIMDQYNVQIIPRPKQKNFHAMTIVVKGCEWECARVKEATLLLMEHLCKVRNDICRSLHLIIEVITNAIH